MMDPWLILLGWCVRHKQNDLLEAMGNYGYQNLAVLIKLLIEIEGDS